MDRGYILVTGCDSGFGRALAETLVMKQHPVILCFHRDESMHAFPSSVRKHVLDVTCKVSVEKFAKYVHDILKTENAKLGSLVHNAGGLLVSGPVEWSSLEQDKAQMDLNFFGSLRVVKCFLPYIRESQGRIVLVSSLMGLVGSPLGGIYAASKFALEGWADSLRREMLAFQVSVHLIEPGMYTCTNFYGKYDSLVKDNWSRMHSSIRDAYGEDYMQYTVKRLVSLKNFFGSNSMHPVLNAMIHALFSSWPKHRYLVGTDCSVLGRILTWIPTSLADLALTIVDPFILCNWNMIPKMPTQATNNWLGMVYMSLFRYNQFTLLAWMCIISSVVYAIVIAF